MIRRIYVHVRDSVYDVNAKKERLELVKRSYCVGTESLARFIALFKRFDMVVGVGRVDTLPL